MPILKYDVFLTTSNVYIWKLQWSTIHSKYINFFFFSQSSKCQPMVMSTLNVWSNWPENKNFFLITIHSHNDVLGIEEFVLGYMGFDFYMLMKYNRFLKMFAKIMGIYDCSLMMFFWSYVRDFWWNTLLAWVSPEVFTCVKLTSKTRSIIQHCKRETVV